MEQEPLEVVARVSGMTTSNARSEAAHGLG